MLPSQTIPAGSTAAGAATGSLLPLLSASSLLVSSATAESAVCCVCLDGDSASDNPILLCDGLCSLAYHALCIMDAATAARGVPDGDWWCSAACKAAADANAAAAAALARAQQRDAASASSAASSSAAAAAFPLPPLPQLSDAALAAHIHSMRAQRQRRLNEQRSADRTARQARLALSSSAAAAAASSSGPAALPAAPDLSLSSCKTAEDFWAGVGHYFDPTRLLHSARLLNATTFDAAARFNPPLGDYYKQRWSEEDDEAAVERPRAFRSYLRPARGTENHDAAEWEHYWTDKAAQPSSPARATALTTAAGSPAAADSATAAAAASVAGVSLPVASASSAGFTALDHTPRPPEEHKQRTRPPSTAAATDADSNAAAPEESKSSAALSTAAAVASSSSDARPSNLPDPCRECGELLNRHRECCNVRCNSSPYFVPEFVFNRSDKTMRCTAHPCSWEGEPTGPDGALECPNGRCTSVSAQAKRAREAREQQQLANDDSTRGDSTPPASRSHRRPFFSGASPSPRKRSHLNLQRVAQAPVRATLYMTLMAPADAEAAMGGEGTSDDGSAPNGVKSAPSSGGRKKRQQQQQQPQQASPSRSAASESPAAPSSSVSSASASASASVDTFVTQFYLNCRRAQSHPSEFPPGMGPYMLAVDAAIAALRDPPEAPPLIKDYIARAYEQYRMKVAEGEQRAAAAAFSSLPRAAATPTPATNGAAASASAQQRPLQHVNATRQSSGSRQVAAAARVLSLETSPAPRVTAAVAATPPSVPANAASASAATAAPREVVVVDDDDPAPVARTAVDNSASVAFAVIPSAVSVSKADSNTSTGVGAGKGELPAADPSISSSLHLHSTPLPPPPSLVSGVSFTAPADPSPDVELPPLVAPPPPYFILRALDLHYAAESNALPPQTDPLALPAAYKYANGPLRAHLLSGSVSPPSEDAVFAAIKGPFAGHYTFPQLYETAQGGMLGDADPIDLLTELQALDPARLEMDLRASRKLKIQAHDTLALNIHSGAVESTDQYAMVDGDEVSTELWLARRELLSQVHANHQRRTELRAAAMAVQGFDRDAYAARVAQEVEYKRVLAEYHAKFPSVYAPACELEQDFAAASAVLPKPPKHASTAGKSNSTALRKPDPRKMSAEEREAHAERVRVARCLRQNETRRLKREADRKLQTIKADEHSSDDSEPPPSERRPSKRAAAAAVPSLGLRIHVKEEGEMSDDDDADDSDDDDGESVRVTGSLYPRQAAATSPSRIVHGVSRSGRITQRLLLPQSAQSQRRRSGGDDDTPMHDDSSPGALELESLRKQQSANRAQRQRRQELETSRVMAKRKANSNRQQQRQQQKLQRQQASAATVVAKTKPLPPLPEFDSSELACIQARRASETSTRVKFKLCILKPLLPESTRQALREVKSARTPRSHTRRRVVSSSSDSSTDDDDVILSPGCVVCGGMENPSQVLLCDDCDSEVHLYCNRPPLKNVPRGKFFCPACKEKKADEAAAAAAAAPVASPIDASPDPSASASSPSSASPPFARDSSRPPRARIAFSRSSIETVVLSPTSLARIEEVVANGADGESDRKQKQQQQLKFKLKISKPLLPESTRQSLAEIKSAQSAQSARAPRTSARRAAAANRSSSSDEDDGVILSPGCVVCGGMENPSEVLLCDDCDSEVHLYCNQPPLKSVPKGKFFCPICKARKAEAAAQHHAASATGDATAAAASSSSAAAASSSSSAAAAAASAPAALPSRVSCRPRKAAAAAAAGPPEFLTAEMVESFVLSPGTLARYFERNVKSPEWPTSEAFDAVLGLEKLLTSDGKTGSAAAAAAANGEVRVKRKYVRKVHPLAAEVAAAAAAAPAPAALTPAKRRAKTDGSDSSLSSSALHLAPPAMSHASMDDVAASADPAASASSAAASSASISVPVAKRIRLHAPPAESLRTTSRRSCTLPAAAAASGAGAGVTVPACALPAAAAEPSVAVPVPVSKKRGRPPRVFSAAVTAACSIPSASASASLPFVATCPASFFAGEEGEEEEGGASAEVDSDDLLPLSSLLPLSRADLPGLLDEKAIAAAAAAASALLIADSTPAPELTGGADRDAEEMGDERKEDASELSPLDSPVTPSSASSSSAPCKRARVHNELVSAAAAAAAAAAASAAAVASFEAAFDTAAVAAPAPSADASAHIAALSHEPSASPSSELVSHTSPRPSRAAANAAAHRMQFASMSESTRKQLQNKL